MCVFNEKDFKGAKKLNILFGAGIFAVVLAFFLPLITIPGEELATKYTLAQLSVSSIAFIIILITLCLTIVEFRKSMAKPKLEVIFSDTGKAETTIVIPHDTPQRTEIKHELKLSILNTGNAITKFFQIDFLSIPPIYRPRLDASSQLIRGIPNAPLPPEFTISEDESVVSCYNLGQITCFVKKPAQIPSILIGSFSEKYKEYVDFKIKYRIYGDWAETQEGELKVNINKK